MFVVGMGLAHKAQWWVWTASKEREVDIMVEGV